jgi:hypothetical protein
MSLSVEATSLVLVAVMTDPRDLEIARLLGWYRIPLRSAPKVIAVDQIAFYQSSAFADAGGCIQYVAQVKGHELVTRGELLQDETDHPRAGEEYFKIQIGPLELLPHPILAGKWKRVTFLYTTGEYLLKAVTINDLVIHSEERHVLWKALRERLAQPPEFLSQENSQLPVDEELLAYLLGIHGVDDPPR